MRDVETIDSQIVQMRKEIDEIKTPQGFKGDSWIFYRNVMSDATWDLQGTIIPANTLNYYKITLTPLETKPLAAVLRVFYDISIGTHDIFPVNNTDNQWWFTVNSQNSGNMVFNYKFIIYSTQKGTVSYVQV